MATIQLSTSLDSRNTFAHVVGERQVYGGTQPPYVAAYIGGHVGVRVSLSPDEARALAAVPLATADVEAGLPDTATRKVDDDDVLARAADLSPVPA